MKHQTLMRGGGIAVVSAILVGAVLFGISSPKQITGAINSSAPVEVQTGGALEIGDEVETQQDSISIENTVYDFAHFVRHANAQYVNLEDVQLESFLSPCFAARGIANYEYQRSVDDNGVYVFKGENVISSVQYEVPVYDVDKDSKYFVAFPNLNKNSNIYGSYGIQCTYNNYYGENIRDIIWENDILYIPKTSFTEPYNEHDSEEGVYAIQLNYYIQDENYLVGKDSFDRDILVEVNNPNAQEADIKTINVPNMYNTYFTIPNVIPDGSTDNILVMVNGMLLPISEDAYSVSGKDLIIQSPACIVSNVNIVLDVDKNEGDGGTQSLWESFLSIFRTNFAHAATEEDVDNRWPADATPGITMDQMSFLYDKPSWNSDRSLVVLEGAENLFVGWRGSFQTGEWLNLGGRDPYDPNYNPTDADKITRLNGEETYVASVEALYGGKAYSDAEFDTTGTSPARWAIASYCSGYDELPSHTSVNGQVSDSTKHFSKNSQIKLYKDNNDSEANLISIVSNDGSIDTAEGNGVSIFNWMLIYRNSLAKVKLAVAAEDYDTWKKKPASLHVTGVGGGMLNMAFKLPTANETTGKRVIYGLDDNFVSFGPHKDDTNSNIRFVLSSDDGINTGDFWMAATCAHTALTADTNEDVENGSTVFASCIGKGDGYVVLAFARPAFGKQAGFGIYKFSTGQKVKVKKEAKSDDAYAWAKYNGKYDTLDTAKFSLYDSSTMNADHLVQENLSNSSDAVIVATQSVWLKETKTPLGYKNAGSKKFKLADVEKNSNNEYVLTMEDEPVRISIPFKKIDSRHTTRQGDASLENATYNLTYSDGNRSVVATVTTKSDGTVKNVTGLDNPTASNRYHLGFSYENGKFNVPMGTLKIKEVSPSDGYSVDPTEYTLTIKGQVSEDNDTELSVTPTGTIYNKNSGIESKEVVKHGNIEVQKYDATTLKPEPQGNASFENITYKIINRSSTDVIGPDGNVHQPGTVVCTIKTDANGHASTQRSNMARNGWNSWPQDEFADGTKKDWEGALAYGQYEVIEGDAAEGYLLGVWSNENSTAWHGFATKQGQYEQQWLQPNGQAFMPSTTVHWIDDNGATVKFDDKNSSPKNTVKRGHIELIKYDDQIKRSEAQGDGNLENIQFDIINRSVHAVVSPEDGKTLIQPGQVVCRITTKKVTENDKAVYKASTMASGVNQKKTGSSTWNTPSDWHGALAYGYYQVVEVSPDGKYVGTGYLFGVWTGNTQKVWHGNAADSGWNNNWLGLASGIISGSTFTYTNSNGQKFDPSSNHKWIDDDKVTVSFTGKDSGPNNSVQRGDIELIKSDDNWNGSRLQGDADLAGAVFEIYNASKGTLDKGIVVSPQTGEEVAPGGLVCTITSFKDTDGRYKATTYCPAGSAAAAANGWSIPATYGYLSGDSCGHALPYGQYIVVEKTPSTGYMLNSEWVGRAINNDNINSAINFSVTNGNKFTLDGKTSNASATPTWINEQGALVKFDNKKENENKTSQEHYHNGDAVPQVGESLDTVDRADESWIENTVFRGGIRIGKVDRQNGDYKPQGGATLETAIITVSSLCDNPIWTLKGTYANGEKPTWGEVEAWTGNNRSKKDGVDFLNIMVHKVTKTDGTVQYYASTRDDKGVAGVDFDDGALDITLPYGRYMMREISVDSPDQIYDALTNVNSGYLYDTISQNWRRQFSIGYETNTKHPALTYYSETGSFSTLVSRDTLANPTAIRVTPTDTIVYDPADNHPVSDIQTVNSKHGTILDMTATNDAVPNLVSRFDIEFIKKNPDDKLLAGAVFAITSKTTGETHIAITDENGKFSSFPENQISWHTKKTSVGVTNGNDEGILTQKSDADITYLDISTDDNGVVAVDMSKGINRIQNADGKEIIDSTHALTTNGVWFYGRTDKKTLDPATATGNGSTGETGNVNEDTKFYTSSVKPDEIQMYRNDMGAFPYDDYIIQELPTANTVGYDMVRFEVHMVQATKASPSDGLKNRIEMELKSPDPILRMEYPEYYKPNSVNAGTVTDEPSPEIHTTLVNEDDVPVAAATENYTLIDKVQWANLKNGHEYRLVGTLYQKDENDQLIGGEAAVPIATNEQKFVARGTNGVESMIFSGLDLTKLGGEALVAFEYLYDDATSTEIPLVKHADATDDSQTVTIPEICTTLTDADGDKEISAYKEAKLIDHVTYKRLKPGQIYTFTGVLHLQEVDENGNIVDGGVATDASGNPITATKDELIKTRDGTIDIEFTFMAPDLQGKKVVAFEECKNLDYVYAVHTDITDVAQTAYFPELQTTALDGITDDHIGLADEFVTLKDIVAYKNLVKGKSYEIDGTLMNKETGEPIKNADGTNVTGTLTFVAGVEDGATITKFGDIELASGTVEVPFTVSSDVIRGVKAVVFEKLYNDEGGHEVEISKTDAATSKELPGAKLIIKRGDTIVAAWTSTDTPHKVKLSEGTYTLTELTAPAGYEVAETIEFTVDANGLVGSDKVEMKDAPLPPTEGKEVEISKTDTTTSKELLGATLVIAKDGKTVDSWVSTDTPHKVKLPEGSYTLTEITAPYGYDIAETITFTVDANGLVGSDKVEMRNAPSSNPELEISKTDTATTAELPGATLIIQKDGQLIETWVSTDTPHKVKLPEGTYTLTEITAPYGYDMAETITFKVGANGLVDGGKVEMKDAPKTPVATHEDINDEGQSVTYPDIQTQAHVAGIKAGVIAGGEVHLTDVVTYTNLLPGRKYVMKGLLMDKVTNQPALSPEGQQITAQTEFTPETASGTMEMEFVFNARALEFHDVVVFENAYIVKSDVADQQIHVAKHENIEDEAQTVGFGENDIADAPINSTGDDMPFIPLLITIAVAFGVAGAFGLRRKFTK